MRQPTGHRKRGRRSRPAAHVHPVVVNAIAELGIDVSENTPHKLDQGDMHWADIVVTMGCGEECPYVPGKRYIDWELDDQAVNPSKGSREVRDEIKQRIAGLLEDLESEVTR